MIIILKWRPKKKTLKIHFIRTVSKSFSIPTKKKKQSFSNSLLCQSQCVCVICLSKLLPKKQMFVTNNNNDTTKNSS